MDQKHCDIIGHVYSNGECIHCKKSVGRTIAALHAELEALARKHEWDCKEVHHMMSPIEQQMFNILHRLDEAKKGGSDAD